MSIKSKILKLIRKASGYYTLESEIDALHYYLNSFVDIKNIPPATGNLKKLQDCDTVFLAIIDTICQKFGWKYWLDWGTLLGAYRHHGFIPWDDDLDIGMPRSDYDEALKVLPEYLNSLNLDIQMVSDRPINCIWIGVNHMKTGIGLDIFPYDTCYFENPDANYAVAKQKITEAAQFFFKHKGKNNVWEDYYSEHFSIIPEPNITFLSPTVRTANYRVHKNSVLYPLQKVSFGEYSFYAPNNMQKFLEEEYGKSIMNFPKRGVMSHSTDTMALCDFAESSGFDMNHFHDVLLDVLKQIQTS